MDLDGILKRYGLFVAKVPRYASYPPASRFEPGTGRRHRAAWLNGVRSGETISLYVHVPFCRRLCRFCVSRTQRAQSHLQVEAYVEALLLEVAALRRSLPGDVRIGRLHLGGGTPTHLGAQLMERLLDGVYQSFPTAAGHELSAEVDPTDAADEVLDVLAAHGMDRACIGVQDFSRPVQRAIGRVQSYQVTRHLVETLRRKGVRGIGIDLLYGLPGQDEPGFMRALDKVLGLEPGRVAIIGYAHVPWIARRQTAIPEECLPPPETRLRMAQHARARLLAEGYEAVGIDHFARPGDALADAAREHRLHRGFQGYTDDPAETLIGLGASAISRFREGYVQNAASTSVYTSLVLQNGDAAHRGYALSESDRMVGAMIEDLMCYGQVDLPRLVRAFPDGIPDLEDRASRLLDAFPDLFSGTSEVFRLPPHFACLTRIVCASVEGLAIRENPHDVAV